jgi:hypothetical protein
MKFLLVISFTSLLFISCSSTKSSTTTEKTNTTNQQATQDKPQMDSSGKFVK